MPQLPHNQEDREYLRDLMVSLQDRQEFRLFLASVVEYRQAVLSRLKQAESPDLAFREVGALQAYDAVLEIVDSLVSQLRPNNGESRDA